MLVVGNGCRGSVSVPKNPLITNSKPLNWQGGTHPLMTPQQMKVASQPYQDVLDSGLQNRLLEAAESARKTLEEVLGQRVHLLFPPAGSKTDVPGVGLRTLGGEKKFPESELKVFKDYGGKWDLIKDLARCTLAMEQPVEPGDRPYWIVRYLFDRQRGGVAGFTEKEAKEVDPSKDPCGYSGYTVNVSDGRYTGEIQVNYMNIMYAKSSDEFNAAFGQNKARQLRSRYPLIPGGLGHELYEIYRVQKGSEKSNQAAEASRAYYAYFRSRMADQALGTEANRLVRACGINAAFPTLSWLDESPERLKPGNFKDLFGVDKSGV